MNKNIVEEIRKFVKEEYKKLIKPKYDAAMLLLK